MKNNKNEGVPAIKGMEHDMTCHRFKFDVGETHTFNDSANVCESSFHSCPINDETPPHSVFQYYAPGISRYFDVTAAGKIKRIVDTIFSTNITINVEITLNELMGRVSDWCLEKAKGVTSSSNYHNIASNSNHYSAASNNGHYGAALNNGHASVAFNSGHFGAASNAGPRSAALNTGYRGVASNSGHAGAALNSGYGGAASNSGNYGAALNSERGGAASNSGDYGAALNSGQSGAALNTGYYGAASNTGEYGAAFSHGFKGKVMCEGDGQPLYCTEFNTDGSVKSVACGITGQDGIKAGVWYCTKEGKLVPVELINTGVL